MKEQRLFQPKLEGSAIHLTIKSKCFQWFFLWEI